MKDSLIATVKASIEKMPPLSPVIHKVVQVANDVTSSAQHLTEVIQMDPVLTAKVIKMVNSAYFGFSQEIKSLKQAVVILGINTIKNVALSSVVVGNVNVKANTVLDGEEFWKHSFGVAAASKVIAGLIGIDAKLREEFFVAGLIHDIGKVLINNVFQDEMRKILDVASDNTYPITIIEKKILGLTHEEIGIAIGKNWKFENNLLYAVGKHHAPVTQGNSAVYSMVVSLANYSINKLEICRMVHGLIEPIPEEIWTMLNLEENALFESLGSIKDEITKARKFLQ